MIRRVRAGWLGATLVALCLFSPPAAAAGGGELDSSFGDGGRIATALPAEAAKRNESEPWSLLPEQHNATWITPPQTTFAVGRDGSAAMGMGDAIFKYLPDGELDKTWGRGGELKIDEVEGLPFRLSDVAVDAEGRVLAFGSAFDPNTTLSVQQYWSPFVTHPTFAVALRFDSRGGLDPSYGGGDGVFRSDLGMPPGARAWNSTSQSDASGASLVGVRSAALDSAGRAVITVQRVGGSPTAIRDTNEWLVDSVARLTPGGALDDSFSAGLAEPGPARAGDLYKPVVDRSDRVLLARSRVVWEVNPGEADETPWGEVLRLQTDGAPDPAFGTAGLADAVGGGGAIAADRFGRVAMLQKIAHPKAHPGMTRQELVRFTADGTVDRSFGKAGRAWVTLPGKLSAVSSVAADGLGRVLLAGTLRVNGPHGSRRRSYFTVLRLLASGKPDRSFGHGGWVRTGFGRRTTVDAEGMALLPHGRLLVAGYGRSPELRPAGVVAARYRLGR
jgi:uncharacterized delta-60 repeat protein